LKEYNAYRQKGRIGTEGAIGTNLEKDLFYCSLITNI